MISWRLLPRSAGPAAAQVRPPALLIVGEVVALQGQLGWFESTCETAACTAEA
jgi:hypothetical protein